MSPPPLFCRAWLLASGLLCVASSLLGQTLDEARALQRAGDSQAAAEAYRTAAIQLTAEDPAAAAIAHNNRCVVLEGLGELEAARAACEQALSLRRDLDDPLRLARTLNNFGLVLTPLGDLPAAEAAYREALTINVTLDEIESQVINQSNLGILLEQSGRYGESLTILQHAIDLTEQHREEPWALWRQQIAKINQSVVFERLGAYQEALELLDSLDPEFLDNGSRASRLLNRGVMLRNLGDPQRALAAFESAVRAFEELGDQPAAANAWINRGRASGDLGDLIGAATSLNTARELAAEAGDLDEEIEALIRLGFLHTEAKAPPSARTAFAQVLEIAHRVDAAEGRWAAQFGLGALAEADGELAGALSHYEAALAEIENARSGVQDAALRSGYLVDKRPVYAAAIRVLATMENANPGAGASRAFDWVQRAKARELLESLGREQSAGLSPQNAQQLAPRLGAGGVLVELFVGPESVWAFRLKAGAATDQPALDLWRVGATEVLNAQVEAVHRASRQGEVSPEASELGRVLLGPLVQQTTPASLILAPDRFFHNLPFQVLPWPDDSQRLLLEVMPVGELPSGSALGRSIPAVTAHAPRLVAFGAPTLTGIEAPDLNLTSLPPLAGAAREVEALARSVAGVTVVRVGDAATEDAFVEAVG
ncbi:MAG: tetratricopeptide repeat protein, partial [Thermoanaerobaculia bacterium]|nr:tetratricopeptide repeat protein [Thermoanaerobaculia bacterium]